MSFSPESIQPHTTSAPYIQSVSAPLKGGPSRIVDSFPSLCSIWRIHHRQKNFGDWPPQKNGTMSDPARLGSPSFRSFLPFRQSLLVFLS